MQDPVSTPTTSSCLPPHATPEAAGAERRHSPYGLRPGSAPGTPRRVHRSAARGARSRLARGRQNTPLQLRSALADHGGEVPGADEKLELEQVQVGRELHV